MIEDFVTVKDAMLSGLIPDSYHSLFEKYITCDDKHCKAPLIINRNRTVMKCSNPYCPKILSSRVLKVYNRFGIINFGPKNAYDWVVTSGIQTVPEAMVKAPNAIKPAIQQWLSSYHTAGEILEILAIPGIGSKANKMMQNINNLRYLQQVIEYFGVQRVMLKCGIRGKLRFEWWEALKEARQEGLSWEDFCGYILKNSATKFIPYDSYETFNDAIIIEGLINLFELQLGGTGRDAQNCAESVYTYWNEIKIMFNMSKCLPNNVETKKIIITGDIVKVTKPDGSMFERLEFIDYANQIALESGVRYQNSTAFASSEFVIADYPSNTNKYRRGVANGNLITSEEFIKILKERAAKMHNE